MSALTDRLDEIEARAEAATKGPWCWRNTSEPYLMGAASRVVMAFRRMGMSGAQPQFRDRSRILVDGGRANLHGFPDAAFIEHARDDVPWLVEQVRIRDEALRAVLELHQPIDALMNPGRHERVVKVCTGCGTDDGNWQRHPCATVRAITAALAGA